MNIFTLSLKNITGKRLRSLMVLLCVFGVTVFFVGTTLIVRGAQNSLDRGLERLGADILVVPQGAEAKVETALLMGKPTEVWMSRDYIEKVAAVNGVGAVSPQIYLQSLYGASCCAVSEMFLVVYDPETDFTITPWLKRHLKRPLEIGEVIGGSYIFTPPGEKYIKLYGYNLTLRGNLEPTGTGLDQTMFLTYDTAQDMARSSLTTAQSALTIPPGKISSIMAKVEWGEDIHKVALQMLKDVVGVTPIESPSLFGTFRQQMLGLLWGFLALMSLAWILAGVLIGLVFSLATNERQREMAILRATGASRVFVLLSMLTEAVLLAGVGAILGMTLASLGVFMFKDYVAGSLKVPFLFPPASDMLLLYAGALGLSLFVAILAALPAAFRVNQREPALAMRE